MAAEAIGGFQPPWSVGGGWLVCALYSPLALGFQWGLWRFRHRGVLLMNEPIFWHISARTLYGWAGADLRAHIASQGPRLRTSPPPLYVNQTHEDWSLPAYSVFRAGRDPARHLFFRRGGNRKSQCRATGRPVGQRQSGAAFVDCVNIFTCNLRCKVPCSILHATLSF